MATQLLLDHVEEELGEGSAIDEKGRITPAAARFLSDHLGERPGLQAGVPAEEVPSFVTPGVLSRSVEAIVNEFRRSARIAGLRPGSATTARRCSAGPAGSRPSTPMATRLTKRWIREFEDEHHLFRRA